jgi:hypothetical protein
MSSLPAVPYMALICSAYPGSAGDPLGKLVTEKPVDFVGFDNVVEFNKNRQNDDDVVKAYKS